MRTRHAFAKPRRQRGAVLIVSLLFLVILTMLGVTAMSGTTLEHRMAGNTRDHAIALQAAEAALRDAHRDVNPNPRLNESGRNAPPTSYGQGTAPGTCGSGLLVGLCVAAPQVLGPSGNYVLPANSGILTQPWVEYGTQTKTPPLKGLVSGVPNTQLPVQPRYWVESLCGIAPPGETVANGVTCGFRRITARGFGVNPNTQVTLQEVYRIAVF